MLSESPDVDGGGMWLLAARDGPADMVDGVEVDEAMARVDGWRCRRFIADDLRGLCFHQLDVVSSSLLFFSFNHITMDDLSTGSESDYSNSCVRRVGVLTCRWISWFLSTKGNVRGVFESRSDETRCVYLLLLYWVFAVDEAL